METQFTCPSIIFSFLFASGLAERPRWGLALFGLEVSAYTQLCKSNAP